MVEGSPTPSSRMTWSKSIDAQFSEVTQKCPGCLYNCYIMEETIGLDFTSIGKFLRSALFMILEIPTVIQMAKVKANRVKKS